MKIPHDDFGREGSDSSSSSEDPEIYLQVQGISDDKLSNTNDNNK